MDSGEEQVTLRAGEDHPRDFNLRAWFNSDTEYEEWQKQMFVKMNEAYNAYLDERVEELATFYQEQAN